MSDRPVENAAGSDERLRPGWPSCREAIVRKLKYAVGKNPIVASRHDWFVATALAVRDEIVDRWIDSTTKTYRTDESGSITSAWSS